MNFRVALFKLEFYILFPLVAVLLDLFQGFSNN